MSMPAERLTPTITLEQLLHGLAVAPPVAVTGISSDSRDLTAGDLFLACQGGSAHGLDFLDQAVAANVAAVAWDSTTGRARPATVPMVAVDGLATHLGTIANRWFDNPSSKLRVTGVTGTNGKTTIAYLLRQCLQLVNQKCAYIGTLGGGVEEISATGGMTTPACIELHRLLATYVRAGAQHAAIEVSSHALQQRRVDGVHFCTAIFSNLSRDHIDYHGSMRAYGDIKASLFLDYDVEHRIVCVDTPFGLELALRIGSGVVSVATAMDGAPASGRHVTVQTVDASEHGSRIAFSSSWGDGEILLPLPGHFNVANAMQVMAALLCWDISVDTACKVLGQVAAPPGRMQRVILDSDCAVPAVYVDYSHTPASLEAALSVLRGHCSGELWCVFGCGGDRDQGKRRLMGSVAAQHADRPLVTSDNPRSEAPEKIIAAILEEMDDDTLVIEERELAIAHAINAAADNDIVLIAGKGHEDYQIIGDQRRPFSDYEVALASLSARSARGATGR